MKDPKLGYHWIWILPYYFLFQIYLFILEKWFPKQFKKSLKVKNERRTN
jgi:hypothetical protein